MATTTSLLPEVLEPWVTDIFFNEYALLPTIYDQLLNIVPSTRAMEDTFQVAGVGTFVLKPEGTPINYDDPVQSLRKRVVHSTYSLGFRVTMEMQDDDQHGIIAKMPGDLGTSARDHKERLGHEIFNDAFAGATYTGIPDGANARLALCAATHTLLKTGATASNLLAPAVALTVSGLEAAVTNFRLTVDENGRQIVLQPRTVFTHPNEEFNAAQILDSSQEPFTGDNQINSVQGSRLGLTHLQSPYLTDTDNWFLMADKSQHSLKWYNRMELTFDRSKASQTKDSLYDAMYRASVTFDDWRGIVGSAP
jgi:hypothetical protein